jgi:hypothetical protein
MIALLMVCPNGFFYVLLIGLFKFCYDSIA